MIRIASATSRVLLALLMVATGSWGALALAISGPPDDTWRVALATGFAVLALAALLAWLLSRRRWTALVAYLVLFAALLTLVAKPGTVERARLAAQCGQIGLGCH